MSTCSSTQAVSSDVAELKDMVRALILDRKNYYFIRQQKKKEKLTAFLESLIETAGV
ncbi:hypothetical protein Tco_0541666, partial [Tanacetum coccineum]